MRVILLSVKANLASYISKKWTIPDMCDSKLVGCWGLLEGRKASVVTEVEEAGTGLEGVRQTSRLIDESLNAEWEDLFFCLAVNEETE